MSGQHTAATLVKFYTELAEGGCIQYRIRKGWLFGYSGPIVGSSIADWRVQPETCTRYMIKYPNGCISRQHWTSYETAAAWLNNHRLRVGSKVVKLVEEV